MEVQTIFHYHLQSFVLYTFAGTEKWCLSLYFSGFENWGKVTGMILHSSLWLECEKIYTLPGGVKTFSTYYTEWDLLTSN